METREQRIIVEVFGGCQGQIRCQMDVQVSMQRNMKCKVSLFDFRLPLQW